jgi:hypothetical protein
LTAFWQSQLICPSCQSAAGIFGCDVGQITGIFPPVSRLKRGALRGRHERWERDAVDAAAHETNAPGADGEVVWS